MLLTHLLALLSTASSADPGLLAVDDSTIRLLVSTEPPEVVLVVDSRAEGPTPAVVGLELVDPADEVRGQGERRAVLSPGRNELRLRLQASLPGLTSDRGFPFHRLRYHVRPQNDEPVEGIVSVSVVASDLFEVTALAGGWTRAGATYPVVVRAAHPVTDAGVAGIDVTAAIWHGDEDVPLAEAAAVTDQAGVATLELRFPETAAGDL